MRIELIGRKDKAPLGVLLLLDDVTDEGRIVRFGAGLSDLGIYLPAGQRQPTDQRLRAMTQVVALPFAGVLVAQGQVGRGALEGLDATFLVRAHHQRIILFQRPGRRTVEFTQQRNPLGKVLPVLNVRTFVVGATLGLKGVRLLKNHPLGC